MNSKDDPTRGRLLRVFAGQGLLGLAALVAVTILRLHTVGPILAALGPAAPLLILIFVVFAVALGLLKFELTSLVFASLLITAYMAMFPLLGAVISTWVAVVTSVGVRYLGMRQVGPVKIAMDDPILEWAKTFGMFGTYGLPVAAASLLFELTGGTVPLLAAPASQVARLAACSVMLIAVNSVVMARVMVAYGYPAGRIVRLSLLDASIYLLTVPYAVCLALSFASMGWPAVLALAFTGVLANLVARNLAVTRGRSLQQIQRLVSLSNIGKTISLNVSTDELMRAIYTECRKIVDVSLFAIALLDEATNELVFELDVREGIALPKERIPLGEGLNSWVIAHHAPLLIGSVEDEQKLGIAAVPDTKPTESWLGVPMIARDRVIGVISVESYRKNVFTVDDVLLLTSIANQAAVALENAHLYKDMEGLTRALEKRVEERTNELREANLRLVAADRSKNQFLANMSHELRTPLNSIIGFSAVLLQGTEGMLAPRLYRFLENIRTAGYHLLALINDILDLSKIEAGKMELRPDRFDVRDTLASVERVMKALATEANVPIVTAVDPAVPEVVLDEGRLKQILFNLLSNAVKFSPDGGLIRVRVDVARGADSPLKVDALRIAVEDQGIGMTPEELEHIFDEFYQTEEGRRAWRKGGTGLGLPLTRNFVELHDGRIEVVSAPGKGSTFVLWLPLEFHGTGAPAAAAAGSGTGAAR